MSTINVDVHSERLARVSAFLRLLRSTALLVLTAVIIIYVAMLATVAVSPTGITGLLRLFEDPETAAAARHMLLPQIFGGPIVLALVYSWILATRKTIGWVLLLFFIGVGVVALGTFVTGAKEQASNFRLAFGSWHAAIVVAVYFCAWAWMLAIWYALLMGGWAAWQTSRDKRSARAMVEPTIKGQGSFGYLFGVPDHVRLLGRRRRRATLLFMLSTIVTAVGIFLFIQFMLFPFQFSGLMISDDFASDPLDVRLARFSVETASILPLFVAGPLLLVVAGWVSMRLESWARRTVRLTMEEALEADLRAPVVFLRSFLDDQVALPRSWRPISDFLLQPGMKIDGLDQLLLREGFSVGPVVALGKPSDPYPPYGAARGYFAHENWQGAVKQLCLNARSIVICVDDSEAGGVWWELEYLTEAQLLDKTLVLLHPRFRAQAENQNFIDRMRESAPGFASNLASVAGGAREGIIALSFAKDGAVERFSSSDFGDLAYLALIRWHLRRTA